MNTRICKKCQIEQPIAEFYTQSLGGHQWTCKECFKKRSALWRQSRRKYLSQQAMVYARAHPEQTREKGRRWIKNHPEKHKENRRIWERANPEKRNAATARYHARKMKAIVVEKIVHLTIFTRDKWICQICFKKVVRKEATIDHIVPLSKGGEHSYRNCVLAHRSCNSSKGNRVVPQQLRLFG